MTIIKISNSKTDVAAHFQSSPIGIRDETQTVKQEIEERGNQQQ